MTVKRFMIDDCGTLIDMHTRDTFDYVSDVCELLNEQHETIERLQKDNKILMDKMFEMRTNKALNRTEISNQSYTVDEFLEELEKW